MEVILIKLAIKMIWKKNKKQYNFGIKKALEHETIAWFIVRGWDSGHATPNMITGILNILN